MSPFASLKKSIASGSKRLSKSSQSEPAKGQLCNDCKRHPPTTWFQPGDEDPVVVRVWRSLNDPSDSGHCPVCLFGRDLVGLKRSSEWKFAWLRSYSNALQPLSRALDSGERVLKYLLDIDQGGVIPHSCEGNINQLCRDCGINRSVPSPSGDLSIILRLENFCRSIHPGGEALSQNAKPTEPNAIPWIAENLEKLIAEGIRLRKVINRMFLPHNGSKNCPICRRHKDISWGTDEDVYDLFRPDLGAFLMHHRIPQQYVGGYGFGPKTELVSAKRQCITFLDLLRYAHQEDEKTGMPHPTGYYRIYPDKPQDHGILVPFAATPKYGHGRRIGPRFDVEIAKSWLNTCAGSHGDRCKSGSEKSLGKKQTLNGVFLIDTNKWCLFRLPDEMSTSVGYAALSYVWGPVKQPQLSISTVEAWQTPNQLQKLPLPATIKDAITLARSLGFQYLWVDALCIIQDEPGIRHDQISQMFRIYNNAGLTIVAANSSGCDTGLSGLTLHRSRADGRGFWNVMGTEIMMIPAEPQLMLEASTWRKRGWTFQEELCSTKALIFLPNLVMFSCQQSTWREDIYLEDGPDLPRSGGLLTINKADHRTDVVPLFQNLINQYLSRTLTRATDIENAFAGVAGLMDGFVGPLYHGIPERYFDEVIQGCWFWDHNLNPRPPFPSWSWTGWEYTAANVEAGGIVALSTWKNAPLLQFFAVSDPPRLLSAVPATSPHHPHFEPALEEMTQAFTNVDPVKRDGLLAFYTSHATLKIQAWRRAVFSDPEPTSAHEYAVLSPQNGKTMTTIRLRESCVPRAKDMMLSFIVTSYSPTAGYRLMAVEEIGGVAYKHSVSVPGRLVPEHIWWDVQPRKKLIILG